MSAVDLLKTRSTLYNKANIESMVIKGKYKKMDQKFMKTSLIV